MAKKNQGASAEKRQRERNKMFKRREKVERRRIRKEEKARGEEASIVETDSEAGEPRAAQVDDAAER